MTDDQTKQRYQSWLNINEAMLMRNHAEIERQVQALGGGESVEKAVSTLRKKREAFLKANIQRLKGRLG